MKAFLFAIKVFISPQNGSKIVCFWCKW